MVMALEQKQLFWKEAAMDESFIYERLKALNGNPERPQYREISKAFLEIVRYNEKALNELKKQLSQELQDVSERLYLYGAVTKVSDAPIVNDFLFPISSEKPAGSIASIFCKATKSEMEELFSSEQKFLVETGKGTKEILAKLLPCTRYYERLEQLEHIFYENGLYWRAPYLPYIDKFADIYCEEWEGEEICSIRLKDREIFIEHDLIPLWNVEVISLTCTVFPIPAIDEQNYKHTLRLPYPQDGYAAALGQDIKSVYRSEAGLEVITEEPFKKDFKIYRIAVKRDIHVPHYGLSTNFRPMRHIDRQAEHAAVPLFTMAELRRIVGSYEAVGSLKLAEVEKGRIGPIRPQRRTHQFEIEGREMLCLKFQQEEPDFLTEDLISFLAGEAQRYFPQFLITASLLGEDERRSRG